MIVRIFRMPCLSGRFRSVELRNNPSYLGTWNSVRESYIMLIPDEFSSRQPVTGGLGPQETEIGDQVYMCIGAPVPFVLREVHRTGASSDCKQVRLVGKCYVNGSALRGSEQRSDAPEVLYIL